MYAACEALEAKLGYRFRNRELLLRALTHRSRWAERPPSSAGEGDNEQFEFLGDSILGFIVSESLFRAYPSAKEGELSRWKASLVSAKHLHRCAVNLGLGEHLLLGKGEEMSGGREKKALLANALEAVIAAIYMDGGLAPARQFINQAILASISDLSSIDAAQPQDYKNVLQEQAQALRLPAPQYAIISTNGPEHAKSFTVEARIGPNLVSRAQGSSKKAAGQSAAKALLDQLTAEPVRPLSRA